MPLEDRIESEFKSALKAGDKIKVSTLRMLKADINNTKLDPSKKDFGDGEVIKIIQRQVKQHKDSIEQFEKGNRQDLVEKEKKELEILLSYLPEQLGDTELEKIIKDTIGELGLTDKKEMGKIMKSVMEKVKGKADGKRVSQIVSNLLK